MIERLAKVRGLYLAQAKLQIRMTAPWPRESRRGGTSPPFARSKVEINRTTRADRSRSR